MDKIIYRKQPERKRYLKLYLTIFILFLSSIMFLGYTISHNYKSAKDEVLFISPLAKIINKTVSFINSRQNNQNLEQIMQNILKDDRNQYGIVIDNLNTGERYYFNQDKIFDTASLYKLWIMAVTYQKIENGNLSKTAILSDTVENLNEKFNISSESAELTEGEVSWPVQNALEQMIAISDNYSAYLLTEKIGLSSVSEFLEKYGFSESKVGTLENNPTTSAHDIAGFLKQLYNGQLANLENTAEMIGLLKQQRIDTKLSNELSQTTIIAHKTGELNGFSHDAGIIYAPKGNYIIVILSKTNSQLTADRNIAEISKEVYNYFTK